MQGSIPRSIRIGVVLIRDELVSTLEVLSAPTPQEEGETPEHMNN